MDGDPIAQLLDVAAEHLSGYGYLLTGSRAAGDALVHDAIVRVRVRNRRLNDPRAMELRVLVAMRALHLAAIRREGAWWAPRARAAPPPDELTGPLSRALGELSPAERAAVVLRHHDHVAVPDVATAMRISEASAERLLASANATLEARLGPLDPEPDEIPVVSRRRA